MNTKKLQYKKSKNYKYLKILFVVFLFIPTIVLAQEEELASATQTIANIGVSIELLLLIFFDIIVFLYAFNTQAKQ